MTDRFDPLATSELITSGYRRYLRSLLPVREPRIATALDHQITHSPLLTKGPLLEATPPYQPGATLDDADQGRRAESGVSAAGQRRAAAHSAAARASGAGDPQGRRRAQRGRRHGHWVRQDRELPAADPQRAVRRARARRARPRRPGTAAVPDERPGQRPDEAAAPACWQPRRTSRSAGTSGTPGRATGRRPRRSAS